MKSYCVMQWVTQDGEVNILQLLPAWVIGFSIYQNLTFLSYCSNGTCIVLGEANKWETP